MRVFVMGDKHGAAKAMEQCFERSGFDFEKDTLIDLGDVCDGWLSVKECVDQLLKCKNLIAIQGNHDWWFDQWLRTGVHPVSWLHGGHTTAESYARAARTEECPIRVIPSTGAWITNLSNVDIPKSHQDFFGKQVPYYVDNKHRLFVHGGFRRELLLVDNDHSELMWDRRLWNQALSCVGGNKLVTADGFSEIFIGHSATTNWKHKPTGQKRDAPMNSGGVWNVDTGAGFDGKLTIMNVETKEYFQSDPVQDLYPDEAGRN